MFLIICVFSLFNKVTSKVDNSNDIKTITLSTGIVVQMPGKILSISHSGVSFTWCMNCFLHGGLRQDVNDITFSDTLTHINQITYVTF